MKLDKSMAAIVTGGASGLGEATARMLAAEGAKVAIFDMNARAGEAVAREIGGVFCHADVTDEASDRCGSGKSPGRQRHRAHSGQLRRHRAGQAHGREEARDRRADRRTTSRASAAPSRST